jgi:RsiW-degrading membrane proteinase PrsW (M82 family)
MANINYPFYIFFALAPSIIWLLFFLRKDSHPESNKQIIKIFFLGMLIGFPAILLEIEIFKVFNHLNLSSFLVLILYIFIGVALVEEFLKYLVVREWVLADSEFDEPADAILYMIIAALGFAALENLLILWPGEKPFFFLETFTISSLRFLGATFLHVLASGTIGYFLALSLFESKKRNKLLITGFLIAIFLHGLYNFSIILIKGNERFIIPIIILISLSLFISFGFKKIKKIKSVCKIIK